MDKNNLIKIHNNLKEEYKQSLSRYLSIMQKMFPIYVSDIGERKMQVIAEASNQIDREFDKLLEYIYSGHYDENYKDPLNSESSCRLSSLFFDYLYNDKVMDKDDLKFIKRFINIVDNGRLLQTVLYGKNPYMLSDYTDSKILYFDNEDIIITDPCYYINQDDDIDKVMNNIKMIYQSTLYGDWSCTVFIDNNPSGTFCADAGLVSVASLKDVLVYNPEFDYHINRKWTTAMIPNFTGDVQIKVAYSDRFYCYIEGKGNVNFIGRQTGL